MFSKPLSFILVYVLSIINFTIILSPLSFFLIPLLALDNGNMNKHIKTILLLSIFVISLLMLVVLFFDFLFGFSIKPFLKKCIPYHKDNKYKIFYDLFEEIKYKFGKNAELLIKRSSEINAFAVGGLRKNYIILTEGIISHYLMNTRNKEEFLDCMKGIIGHEMSHLINKDYLPGLLLSINEEATMSFSKIIFFIFNFFVRIFSFSSFLGYIFSTIFLGLYKIFDFIIRFFHKYIILNVYKFILLQISKEIEYRCDKQSAKASGGDLMSFALSFLNEDGYTTIFSTHPKTHKRIKKVQKVKMKGRVRASVVNKIVNAFSLLTIFYITILCGVKANIPVLIEDYNNLIEIVSRNIYYFKMKVMNFFGGVGSMIGK